MSERKVLNKYYPPDFDPSNIPKLKLPRNRQYSIRIMAPFNMKCNTCGEYIYKGKKFNSRKETVEDEDYLGLRIFRFYIKCPRCVAEIAFKTDPMNTDYALEDGATRNFEPLKTAEMLAKKEQEEKEEEEKDNPMKVLENRTKASQREMEMLETLEDLREINSRNARLDHNDVIKLHTAYEEQLRRLQDEEDEQFVQSLFGKEGVKVIKRLDDDSDNEPAKKLPKLDNPTDFLTQSHDESSSSSQKKKQAADWQKSVGSLSSTKSSLKGLVKRKTPNAAKSDAVVANSNFASCSNTEEDINNANDKRDSEKPNSVKSDSVKTAIVHQNTTSKGQTVHCHSLSQDSSTTAAPVSGLGSLGLLGGYSDSDESNGD